MAVLAENGHLPKNVVSAKTGNVSQKWSSGPKVPDVHAKLQINHIMCVIIHMIGICSNAYIGL
jgi:hypothetical protein